MRYLRTEEILAIHDRIVEETGGIFGVRDLNALEYVAHRPQTSIGGTEMFPGVFRKATAYLEAIATGHPFSDGNKRTALTTASVFLSLNGYMIDLSDVSEAEEFMVRAAQKLVPPEDIASWLEKHCTKK